MKQTGKFKQWQNLGDILLKSKRSGVAIVFRSPIFLNAWQEKVRFRLAQRMETRA
ncbi:MAG: hypothetical protein ACTTJF_04960 [Campylobacter sp.]|uniref:hypothetical protein n=1 Tax=Campylobacter sp. TaxID=205 RepID=UPI003FA182EF